MTLNFLLLQPERLEGDHYSVQSDIWSLGLSLIEMAIGVYPIPPPTPQFIDQILKDDSNKPPPQPKIMAIFDLLEYVSNQPPPRLQHEYFSSEFTNFIDQCLEKDPNKRADLNALLVSSTICCSSLHFLELSALLIFFKENFFKIFKILYHF